jgi:putative inorganic carbon (hco3(-)) transporter
MGLDCERGNESMNGLLFTYVLTYGGAIVSLFNPFYGLLVYICFAIVKPPALWPWCVPVGNYSRVIGVALLVGWALNGFGDLKIGRAKPIVICLLGYFIWVLVSTVLSDDSSLGMPFVEYLLKIVLPFIAGVTLIQTRQQVWQLTWVVLFSCAFLAYEANLAYLGGKNIEQDGFSALDNNSFSILMVAGFGLALVLGLEEKGLWRRGFFLGVAAAMAHVPMIGMSRGGMVAAVIAAVAAAVVIPKTPRTWLMIVFVAAIGLRLAGPHVVKEFTSSFNSAEQRDFSAQSRVDLWRDCTITMFTHPLFGVGTEHWPKEAEKFGWKKGKEAHSLWFQSAAELGIPGVLFLIGFYASTILLLWRASREVEMPRLPTLSRMVIVSLVGFSASASFVTVEGFELPYYIVLIGAAAVKVAYAHADVAATHVWNEEPWPSIDPSYHRAHST